LENSSTTKRYLYYAWANGCKSAAGAAGTVVYAYDEAGHLLGEYDGSGTLIEETVGLGDTPVATLRQNGTGADIYYLDADQLNTPRQVTRPSDNAQEWTWFSDPFGTDATNSNPQGQGVFAYNPTTCASLARQACIRAGSGITTRRSAGIQPATRWA
jgi:hypothetical protein